MSNRGWVERSFSDARAREAERKRAVKAVDAMHTTPNPRVVKGDPSAYARRVGTRPLKPPPFPNHAIRVRTAGELALAEDKRKGVIDGRPFVIDEVE